MPGRQKSSSSLLTYSQKGQRRKKSSEMSLETEFSHDDSMASTVVQPSLPSDTDVMSPTVESAESLSEGLLRKQSILAELNVIKKRLQASKIQWENNNWTYTGHFKENLNENLFPKGYGLYLMAKSTVAQEEENIKVIRHAIMAVPSVEIQDGLLSFLEDFLMQAECMKNLTHEREDNLLSVIDWLQTDRANLGKLEGAIVSRALDAEEELRECCRPTMETMEKLAAMKKQMTMTEKMRKDQALKMILTGDEQPMLEAADMLTQSQEEGSDSAGTPLYKVMSKPLDELRTLVQQVRDRFNEDLINDIEAKLDDIGGMLSARESDIRKARAHYRERSEEKEKCQESVESLKEYNEQLLAKINEIKEQQEVAAASLAAQGKGPNISAFRDDAATQVNREILLRDMGVAFRHAGAMVKNVFVVKNQFSSKPKIGKLKPKAKAQQAVADASSSLQTPTPSVTVSSVSESPTSVAASREASSSHRKGGTRGALDPSKKGSARKGKKGAKHEEPKSVSEEVLGGKRQTSDEKIRGAEKSKGKGATQSSSKASPKKSVAVKDQDDKSTADDTSVADVPVDIDYERLKKLVNNHITNMASMAQPFLHELMALRRNARYEIERIKERELAMIELEKNISEFLKKTPGDKDNLPVMQIDITRSNVIVANRVPDSHRCGLCMCHETTAQTVDISKLKSRTVQKKALEVMDDYRQMLDKMRESYNYIVSTISQGHKTIQHTLTQLVWGELGTPDDQLLDENSDVQVIMEVMTMADMPSNISDLIQHALAVTNGVRSLVKNIVTVLYAARRRMNEVKSQNEELRELERTVGLARSNMEDTVLQMSRLRAGKELLRNAMLLGISRCHCCKCYNSFLDDDTRVIPTEDAVEKSKLQLLRNLALLQQALGGVLRPTEDPSVLAVGVDLQVVDDLQSVQRKLSECLQYLIETYSTGVPTIVETPD